MSDYYEVYLQAIERNKRDKYMLRYLRSEIEEMYFTGKGELLETIDDYMEGVLGW
ncbi:MAG: hypothetical protein MJ126_05840 [Lachnospiraceae bacterium]|nr:hypothetical protein [Lachnospiraceae bacterium]